MVAMPRLNVSRPTKLRQLRQALSPKVSQAELAVTSRVSMAAYTNAEQGKPVRYTTAAGILRGLNSLRLGRGLSPLSLEDLELDIT
jgi:hypothetical protein